MPRHSKSPANDALALHARSAWNEHVMNSHGLGARPQPPQPPQHPWDQPPVYSPPPPPVPSSGTGALVLVVLIYIAFPLFAIIFGVVVRILFLIAMSQAD